jgi:hypothetical protein
MKEDDMWKVANFVARIDDLRRDQPKARPAG